MELGLKELLRKAKRSLLPVTKPYGNVRCNLTQFHRERGQLRRIVKGQPPRSDDPKQAEKRRHRREERMHLAKCAIENPTGSKLLRRFARNAGKTFGDDPKDQREGDFAELSKWYAELEEAPFKVGQRLHNPFDQIAQQTWLDARSEQPAVRQTA